MSKTQPKQWQNDYWLHSLRRGFSDFWFLSSVILSILLFAVLIGYHHTDPGWSRSGNGHEVAHFLGVSGAYAADILLSIFGYTAYLLPIGILAIGWQSVRHSYINYEAVFWRFLGLFASIIGLCGVLALHSFGAINPIAVTSGGLIGQKLSLYLLGMMSIPWVMFSYSVLLLFGLWALFLVPWLKVLEWIGKGTFALLSLLALWLLNKRLKSDAPSVSSNISTAEDKRQQLKERLEPRLVSDEEDSMPNEPSIFGGEELKADERLDSEELSEREPQLVEPSWSDYKSHEQAMLSDEDATTLTENIPENIQTATQSTTLLDETEHLDDWIHDDGVPSMNHYDEHTLDTQEADDVSSHEDWLVSSTTNSDDEIDAVIGSAAHGSEDIHDSVVDSDHNDTQTSGDSMSIQQAAAIASVGAAGALTQPFKVRLPNQSVPASVSGSSLTSSSGTHSVYNSSDVYHLPEVELLTPAPPHKDDYTPEEIAEMKHKVEDALKSYRLDVEVVNVEIGPVVTRLELSLAPGIKVSQVTSLDKDIARSLAVQSVRVVEVIPGKPYIGLEIPNRKREIVYMRRVLTSERYRQSRSTLTLILGVDIAGNPVVADLVKMPHLLVAGTTGSGKSVGINVMLISMLYKASPDELKLILIDPKSLEMGMYEDIPHLLTPVVTDMNNAENALKWAVAEMERRYQLMAAMKVRNIEGFNHIVREKKAAGERCDDPTWRPEDHIGIAHQPPQLETLPFIVIVIDELADMMMVVGKKVEELIARIAQKARAAGIHLILATQRPSVDVITGLIKANIPTRIAFQVSSKTDSRTIIESNGAESLLGNGDMLYAPAGLAAPQRVHGAFISDKEVDNVTTFIRSQGQPNYEPAILTPVNPDAMGAYGAAERSADPEYDELYDEAVARVVEQGKASISWLQRRLSIGYNRSARLIEKMERDGIVSPPERGTRRVLVPRPNMDD